MLYMLFAGLHIACCLTPIGVQWAKVFGSRVGRSVGRFGIQGECLWNSKVKGEKLVEASTTCTVYRNQPEFLHGYLTDRQFTCAAAAHVSYRFLEAAHWAICLWPGSPANIPSDAARAWAATKTHIEIVFSCSVKQANLQQIAIDTRHADL